MKITHHTQNRLELNENTHGPVGIAVLLVTASLGVMVQSGFDPSEGYLVLLLWAGAALMLFTAKSIQVTVDQTSGLLEMRVKSLTGKVKTEERVPLHDLIGIQLRVTSETRNVHGEHLEKTFRFEIAALRNNAPPLVLNRQSSSFRFLFFKPKSKDRKTGEILANFLSVPFTQTEK